MTMRVLAPLFVALAIAEVIILSLYVREVDRTSDLRVQMEYANGVAARCKQ